MKQATIINQSAGSKHQKIDLSLLGDGECSENNPIFYTKKQHHATDIAKRLFDEGYAKIRVIGGDGTINEVIQPLVNKNCILEIVPKGTGNDFVKSLDNEITEVDIGKCNDRYFINSASIGFDSASTKITQDKFKNKIYIPNSLSYMLGIIYMLFRYKGINLSLKIDDVEIEQKNFLMVVVANGSYYGHGIEIAPSAKINDGYFDVCLIDSVGNVRLIYLLILLLLKKTHLAKEYKVHKAKKVQIVLEKETYLQIDGELEKAKRFDINIFNKAIMVLKKDIH